MLWKTGSLRHLRVRAVAAATALLLVSKSSNAQIVNALNEAYDVEPGASGRVAGGGSWLSGNADSVQVSGAAVFRYRTGSHLWLALASGAYGIANDEPFVDRELGHLRYRVDVAYPLQFELFGQSDRNPFRRRVIRTVFGAGPRVELFDGPVLYVALGAAYMPEYEKLDAGDFPDSGRASWKHRASGYLSHVVVPGERAKIFHTAYLQPALDDPSNLRAFSDLSVEVTLVENLALTFSHSLQVDTEPPATVRPVDSDRRMTFSWEF